jgi:serpin B
MKSVIVGVLLIICIISLANCAKIQQKEEIIDIESFDESTIMLNKQLIVQSNNDFCIDLFKAIDKDNKNLVFSSFSVSNALAMTAETTGDEISESIRTGLKLPENIAIVRSGYQSILKNYEKENKDYQLNIANALWVEKEYEIKSENQQIVEKYYLGETLAFDNSQPKLTAEQVNQWCDNKTKGMIKDLIQASDIKPLTHLILTNAIYFKGVWENEFKKQDTNTRVFYNSKQEKTAVKFMNTTKKYNYAENDLAQILEMPYKGGELSMLVILPRENDIKSLSTNLTAEMLTKWNENLSTYKVKVNLPKFKFDFNVALNDPLKELGMERAFTQKSANELYIDKVLHKAIVDVNEEGTEAAAVTGVMVTTRSAPSNDDMKIFNADHPFLFVIQDKITKNILFMGKVEQPEYKR